MKILFTRFPLESAYGGAEIQTMTLMRGLIADGHAVAFLGSCPVLLAMCHDAHIPSAKVEIGPPPVTKWDAVSFAWRQGSMERRLVSAFDQFNGIDVVCMLSLSEKMLLTDHAERKGARVFWIEHDRIGRWLTKNPWMPMLRTISKQATTVCVSELSRKMYAALGWDTTKTVAIPNGIDLHHFSPPDRSNEKRETKNEKLVIGTVARLTRDKGVDVLIDAVAGLPNVKLDIIGKGREEDALHEQIKRLGLTDRVRVQPDEPDLPGFYRSLDLFVLPSREHDPFGLVAAEAMASGVPAIVTDACGIAGYLRNDMDAIIVPAGESDALRQAIARLSKEPETRKKLSEAAIQTARELFSSKMMVKRYEMLFTAD